jgi:hypothetical protein
LHEKPLALFSELREWRRNFHRPYSPLDPPPYRGAAREKTMSLEHSPARNRKDASTAPSGEVLFFTQTEAAELLRISARTLERFRLEGRGPQFRAFGRRRLYAKADLIAWADKQVRTSTSDPGEAA